MSNHSDQMPPDFAEKIRQLIGGADARLGGTGKYPRGKLTDEDEGEILIAVAADPKTATVIVDFGKPVRWIGFGPEQASELADMFNAKALEARNIR